MEKEIVEAKTEMDQGKPSKRVVWNQTVEEVLWNDKKMSKQNVI